MIRAAQSILFIATEPQRNTTMRAELVNQPIAPLGIAKRQETFREQLDTHRRAFILRKLVGEQGRNPIAPEQGSPRRGWPGLRQEVILFAPEHARSYPMSDVSVEGTR